MPTPTPHKQTVAIFIICAVVVTATAAYVHGQTSLQNALKGTVSIETATTTIANPYIATDSDWTKDFYGSSTSTVSKTAKKNNTAAANTKITATDKFGREFLTQYANLKKAGQLGDTDAVNAVTEKLLAQDLLVADQPDVYSIADISVTTQNDLAAYKEYGNHIGTIMKNAPARNDAYVVSQGLQSGSTAYLKELDGNIAKYKTILRMMLETRVPSDLRQDHTDFVNGISTTLFIATSLRANTTDPIKALVGLNGQETAITLLFTAFRSIRDQLAEKGVTYAVNEPGSYFNLKP